MKATEIREMSDEQLALTLTDTAKNLFHLRVQAQTERLDAPSELLKARRLIARIKTIQGQRAAKAAAAEEKAPATPADAKAADANAVSPKASKKTSKKTAATAGGK
jgi:large subunit ribosomal protein L29